MSNKWNFEEVKREVARNIKLLALTPKTPRKGVWMLLGPHVEKIVKNIDKQLKKGG